MARVLLFGVAWVLFLAALAVAVGIPARPGAARQKNAAYPAPSPPPPAPGTRYPGWTVTRAYSAHHAMVVEVETDLPIDASSIAAQIVEPRKSRYDEVLIYVRRPGQSAGEFPERRIQWTPRGGYVESVYAR